MSGHPQWMEDIDLYALGVLEGEDKRVLEDHLAACGECREKLEEARGLVALVGLTAPSQAPRPELRKRLLDRVRAEGGLQEDAEKVSFWGSLLHWPNVGWAFAILVVVTGSVLTAVENRRLERQLASLERMAKNEHAELTRTSAALELLRAPDTVRVRLVAGQARSVPEGKVFYHPKRGLLFIAWRLPAPATHMCYQLWLMPMKGNPISAGVFMPDTNGDGAVLMPELPLDVVAKGFAVTVEPDGGMPQPTGPHVLEGGVS
jgi:anti-sigma-K factor RskA